MSKAIKSKGLIKKCLKKHRYFLLILLIALSSSCEQKYSIITIKNNTSEHTNTDPNSPLAGPCQGRPTFQDSSTKKILFYAPADGKGGSPYYRGVKAALEKEGYSVSVSNRLDQNVANFDGCTLWSAYKQVWMWLPCRDGGETKSMDPKSQEALKQFYSAGGGVAVFTDYHYNNTGCDHCGTIESIDNGTTTWGHSSDISLVKNILKITFVSNHSTTFYGKIKSQSNHPLAIASTKIFSIWPTSVSSDQNSNFISLDTNNVTGLIEEKRGNLKSIAFIMPSIYGYEFSITGYSFKTACNFGSGDVWFNSPGTDSLPEAFIAIADYFEQNLRVSAASAKLTNINSPALDKLKELKEDPPQTENMLFEKLKSKNPLEAASALDQLVNNGSIYRFEDLLPFLEHGSFVVRLRASHLIAIILSKEANPHFKILNKLDEPYLSEKAHKALTWSLSFLHP